LQTDRYHMKIWSSFLGSAGGNKKKIETRRGLLGVFFITADSVWDTAVVLKHNVNQRLAYVLVVDDNFFHLAYTLRAISLLYHRCLIFCRIECPVVAWSGRRV